jgi:hypothetical protein
VSASIFGLPIIVQCFRISSLQYYGEERKILWLPYDALRRRLVAKICRSILFFVSFVRRRALFSQFASLKLFVFIDSRHVRFILFRVYTLFAWAYSLLNEPADPCSLIHLRVRSVPVSRVSYFVFESAFNKCSR